MILNDKIDISVIITHWNRPNRLIELLNYLLSSHIQNDQKDCLNLSIEVIIVDSLSEHSILVKDYFNQLKYPITVNFLIKSLFLESNKGPSFARAQGLRMAKGEYIQFIDDDDWISSNKLCHQFRWARSHPEVDLIASCWARVAANEGIGNSQSAELIQPQFDIPLVISVLENFTHLSACLLKNSMLKAVSAFDEEFWLVEDVHLQLKLLQNDATFDIAPSSSPLFFYRSSPESGSLSTNPNRKPFLLACIRNLQLAEDVLFKTMYFNEDSRIRLSNLYGQLARGFFQCDRQIFKQTLDHIYKLNPYYLPKQPFGLRVASVLFGYSRAERISFWWQKIKRRAYVLIHYYNSSNL